MEYAQIESHIYRAIGSLFEYDGHLLKVDASERCITHRLALYLSSEFSNYDVDCEYNRDGFDVKKLELAERKIGDIDVDAVTVFPDIVVHKRGTNDKNLLVIEIKKLTSNISSDYDFEKLKAFRAKLEYKYAVHITLGLSKSGKYESVVVRDHQ